jgi:uncharacterized phiE125 gp8 family phage protein
MNLTVVTPPPFEPVTLAEVYKHLRLDPDHANSPDEMSHPDDDMLTRHIATARLHVEAMARRSFVQRTLWLSYAGFPGSCWWSSSRLPEPPSRILLLRPPVIRVTSVSYYDCDNLPTLLAESDYYVTDDLVPELCFVTGYGVPFLYARRDALRVEYEAGYEPDGSPPDYTQAVYARNVPSPFKDAILLTVQLLYDNLSPDQRKDIIDAREDLVQPYRIQLSP